MVCIVPRRCCFRPTGAPYRSPGLRSSAPLVLVEMCGRVFRRGRRPAPYRTCPEQQPNRACAEQRGLRPPRRRGRRHTQTPHLATERREQPTGRRHWATTDDRFSASKWGLAAVCYRSGDRQRVRAVLQRTQTGQELWRSLISNRQIQPMHAAGCDRSHRPPRPLKPRQKTTIGENMQKPAVPSPNLAAPFQRGTDSHAECSHDLLRTKISCRTTGIVAVMTNEQRRPRQLQINDVSRQFEADCRTVSDAHV